MNLSDDMRKQIMKEVRQYTDDPALGENEFTVRQFARLFSPPLHIRTARNRLGRLVEDGILESRLVIVNKHECLAFRLANGARYTDYQE